MKERQHQPTVRTQETKRELTPPKRQASRQPVQELQQVLRSRCLTDLPADVLEVLAQAVGNGSLLALLRGGGVTPPALRLPEDLPPERWEEENEIETSPPGLFSLEQWPEDGGTPPAPSPLSAMGERTGGP